MKQVMERFCDIIVKDKDNLFETALRLKKMLDALPNHLVERLIDRFKSDPAPFDRLYFSAQGAFFQDTNYAAADLVMLVWVEAYTYSFCFYDGKYKEGAKDQAMEMLQEMRLLPDYTFDRGKHQFKLNKKFEFPSDEEDLIKHIKDFKERLDKTIKSVSSRIS